jgi:hypothetical protein
MTSVIAAVVIRLSRSFFMGYYQFGPVTPNYREVQDYRWVDVFQSLTVVSDAHLPLAEMLVNVYRNKKQPACTINHEGPCNIACGEY